MPTDQSDKSQFILRMSRSLHEWLKKRAAENQRSLNSEMLFRLMESQRAEQAREVHP